MTDETPSPPSSWPIRFIGGGTRNPADHPLPDPPPFDCPTGTCDQTACGDIPRNQAREIDPFSIAHGERNACNRCPTNSPFELRIRHRLGSALDFVELRDHAGNVWNMDSGLTAPHFHGDGGIGRRSAVSSTYRVVRVANGSGGGWQCRYYEDKLDDTSFDLGTYDYADAGFWTAIGGKLRIVDNLHDTMDVQPHYVNPRYTPGLTETY